jgi:hypothetical protein
MARGRSGEHLILRGETYHYRRVVPAKYRKAFGQWEVSKTLDTASYVEAKKLEKEHDVEFESRLSAIREAADPNALAASITDSIRIAGRSVRGVFLARVKGSPLISSTPISAGSMRIRPTSTSY